MALKRVLSERTKYLFCLLKHGRMFGVDKATLDSILNYAESEYTVLKYCIPIELLFECGRSSFRELLRLSLITKTTQ